MRFAMTPPSWWPLTWWPVEGLSSSGEVSCTQENQSSSVAGSVGARKTFEIVSLILDGLSSSTLQLTGDYVASIVLDSGGSGDVVGIIRTSQESQSVQSSGRVASSGSVSTSQPVNVSLVQGAV